MQPPAVSDSKSAARSRHVLSCISLTHAWFSHDHNFEHVIEIKRCGHGE